VNIEIERLSEDGLTRQVWFLSVRTDSVMKDVLVRLEEWRPQRRMYRHRHHNGVHHVDSSSLRQRVPFGDYIINEAKMRAIGAITIQGPVDPTC
jgi:hypothetical protein